MHRAERQFGLSYWAQFNLRHKRRASLQFIVNLRNAYMALVENSVKRDLAYLEIEKAKGADDAALGELMAEAQALLAKIEAKKAVK